jgi:hypothetical protein
MLGDSYWDWDELKIGTQQGILEVNQVMTWSGALTSSTATSSSTVTQRQQGQMHEMGSLHDARQSISDEVSQFTLMAAPIDPYERRKKRGARRNPGCEARARTHPMIQMMAPTKETRTASSAKGRPRSHPSGRHSPSPQQHIASPPPACCGVDVR